jgi:hypothetical protein
MSYLKCFHTVVIDVLEQLLQFRPGIMLTLYFYKDQTISSLINVGRSCWLLREPFFSPVVVEAST